MLHQTKTVQGWYNSSTHSARWTKVIQQPRWKIAGPKKKKKVLEFAYAVTSWNICCITGIIRQTKMFKRLNEFKCPWERVETLFFKHETLVTIHTTLYSRSNLSTVGTTRHRMQCRWLCCRVFHHHSSSMGYLPVRQAVQWPIFLLALLLELFCSFSYDWIPLWTAVTRPSTDR